MSETNRPDPQAVPDASPTDHQLRQFIGYNMKRAYISVSTDMTRVLEPFGLKIMTFSALSVVVENPDITQTQLSVMLGIERSGVVVLVDELENADLISRNRVEGDRRSYALRATLEGQALWVQVEKAVRAHEKNLFGHLSGDEREALRAMLARISGA